MIDINVKVHDKFSVEFKVGYHVTDRKSSDEFALNMWWFIPNSLDINPQTYSKEQFYRDLKSNVRLITPVVLLREIADGNALPLKNITTAFRALASDPSRANIAEYEYQIKMFMAIFKSSLRDEILHILRTPIGADSEFLYGNYLDSVEKITTAYRSLSQIINVPTVPSDVLSYFLFGDEFMSNIIHKYTFRFIRYLRSKHGESFSVITDRLTALVKNETLYKESMGYPIVEKESADKNRALVFRYGVLKKYIESDLFLTAKKKKDGVLIEQMYLSIAAGLSMIFATAIAFSFQQKYGNFTMPLFVALVVSYMLKDRIKELMRYYFAHRLGSKYFDNKTFVGIKEKKLGWIKEGIDFITDDKVPAEVMAIRNRSFLLQAENRVNDEKILLYRKLVRLNTEEFDKDDTYPFEGINDIIRMYLTTISGKMHNPEEPLLLIDDEGKITRITGEKVYYLNIILQLQHENQLDYKRFRVVFNRSGIKEIEELK